MNIETLFGKIAKGETLTEDEAKELSSFDLQKHVDSVAAAARKAEKANADKLAAEKAEIEKKMLEMQEAMKAKGDEGKTELERAQAQLQELSQGMKALKDQVAAKDKEAAELKRSQSLSDLLRKSNVQFVDGLDHGMLQKAFNQSFDGLDDLSDETLIGTKIETFKALNKAAILDNSGGGSGSASPAGNTPQPKREVAENIDDRAKQLEKDGALSTW